MTMLTLSLILYILIVVSLMIFESVLAFSFPTYTLAVIYLLCLLLARFWFSIIYSFHEEQITLYKRISENRGINYHILVISIIALVVFIDSALQGHINRFYIGLLLPIGMVNLYTAFNNDLFPSYFEKSEAKRPTERPGQNTEDQDPEKSSLDPEENEFNELYNKKYSWTYNSTSYRVAVDIRPEVYKKYKEKKRVDYDLWAREYVVNGFSGEIKLLAQKLLQAGKPNSSYDEVAFVLAFTQEMVTYENDHAYYPNAIKEGEYPKYPIETMVEESGDCEDSAILVAALLNIMGYKAALIFLTGHCALGVGGVDDIPGSYIEHDKTKYYYCETTGSGWKIGQLPENYEQQKFLVMPT